MPPVRPRWFLTLRTYVLLRLLIGFLSQVFLQQILDGMKRVAANNLRSRYTGAEYIYIYIYIYIYTIYIYIVYIYIYSPIVGGIEKERLCACVHLRMCVWKYF
jgi:hypothetical protein